MRLVEVRSRGALRLAAGYAAITCVSLSALLFILLALVGHETREQTRETIEQDVRELTAIYEKGGRGQLVASMKILAGSIEAERSLYSLADDLGVIVSSADVKIAAFSGWREIDLPRSSKGPDQFLIFGTRLDGLALLVGRRTHPEEEVKSSVLRALLVAMILTWLFALVMGLWLSKRAFARIDAISVEMRRFADGQLAARAPISGRSDELDALADDINGALNRIEQLVDNLRQISNDLAHDLKTPLGRLRNKLEAALESGGSPGVFLASSIQDIDSILVTFDSLLLIAEIDAGAARARFAPVDVRDVVQHVAEIYAGVIEESGHRLSISPLGTSWISGERSLLTQLIANLVENAIRHTPRGTTIELGLNTEPGAATLVVADSGGGIDVREHENVFRRFYRGDRSRQKPGSGLGLAIVRAIAELHRAKISLASNHPGLRVEISFPTIAL